MHQRVVCSVGGRDAPHGDRSGLAGITIDSPYMRKIGYCKEDRRRMFVSPHPPWQTCRRNREAHAESSSMRLVLFEPDIPQNAGTLLRAAACLGVAVDLVEPCGFVLSDRHFRRAGLDYLERVAFVRHTSWQAFLAGRSRRGGCGRLVLLTTRASLPYVAFSFRAGDNIMVGSESAGVPDSVHALADARLRVPMVPQARSLNVAVAAAMVLGEALRQTGGFPETGP